MTRLFIAFLCLYLLNSYKKLNGQICTIPVAQTSGLSFSSIGSSSVSISWVNGSGNGRIVLVSTSSTFTTPAPGFNPTPSTIYTSGEQCVFNATTGNNVVVTGLSPNIQYYVMVLEYCLPDFNYNITFSSLNNESFFTACLPPSIPASGVTITNVNHTSATINWVNGNGQGRVVYINSINSFSPPPPLSNPTANTQYLGGQQCIYNGNGSGPVIVTGLISNATYYVKVFEYCDPSRNYLVSNGLNNPNTFTTPRFIVTASDCDYAVNVCSDSGFTILPSGFGLINELDPNFNTISNPSINPNPNNLGCLLQGEINSTWLRINVFSTGLLEFTLGSAQNSNLGRCYDWILWKYDSTACNRIRNNQLAPLSCNYNGNPCRTFTGMASSLPAGGLSHNFEAPIMVNCGEQYILCFSNYAGDTSVVPLNFFGSAIIGCGPNVPLSVRASADTVCSSQPFTLTASGALGNIYNWTFSTFPFSSFLGMSGNQAVRNENRLTPTTYRYIVSGNTQHCGVSYDTVDVHVLPLIRNNSIGNSQSICTGSMPGLLTGAVPNTLQGGNGTYQYQWQSSRNNSIWANINGATLPNYNPPVLDSTRYYRRIVTSKSCSDISAGIEILVFPLISGNIIVANQTTCFNQRPDSIIGILPSGGMGIYSYQWQSSSDSIIWANISGATGANFHPPILQQNRYFRRLVNSGPCSSFSLPISIRVLPLISGDTIMAHQTICQGLAPALFTGSLPSGGNNSYQFTWETAPDSIGSWWAIPGGTGQNHQYGVLMDTAFFRRLVVSGPCRDTTAWIRVIVHTPPAPNLIGNQQTICRSSAFQSLTGSLPAGGSGTYSYSWQSSANNSTWGEMTGSNGQGLTGYSLQNTTWFRRIISSPPCASVTSLPVQIRVDSLLGNNTLFPAQTLCSGSTASTLSGSTPSGGSQPYQYQWESSANRTTWTPISGANSNNYPPGVLIGSAYFRRIVSGGPCPPHTSDTILITVHPVIGNNTVNSSQTLCSGTAAGNLVGSNPTGGNGGYNYQWQSSTNHSIWTLVPGIISPSYPPGVLTTSTYFRRIVISPPCPNSTSASVYIQIEPRPGNNTIGNSQTICAGQSPALFTGSQPTGGNSNYVYQWLSSSNNSSWISIGSATSFQSGPLSGNAYFRRLVTSGVCAGDTSTVVSVWVLPPFGNNSIGNSQTLCQGSLPSVLTGTLPTGGSGSYSYQWESSANASTWLGIGGATQLNFTPGLPSATVYFRRFVQSGQCQDYSALVSLIVQSPMTGNAIGSAQTICFGSSPGLLTGGSMSGGNGLYQYQWESGLNGSVWTNIVGGTSIHYAPPALNQATYFRRVVNAPPCPAVTSAFVLIRVDSLIGNNTVIPNQTICTGQTPALIQGSNPSGGSRIYSYSWQSSTDGSSWLSIAPAVTIRDYSPVPLTTTTYYRRIVSAGICTPSTSIPDTIRVVPVIGNNSIGSAQTICVGSVPASLTGLLPNGGSGLYSYAWESSTNGSTWVGIVGANSVGYQPGALPASTYFRRVVSSLPCGAVSSNVILISAENPPGPNQIGPSQTICTGQTPALLTGTIPTGGNGSYTFQWLSSSNQVNWTGVGSSISFQPGALNTTTYYRRVVQSGVCVRDSGNSVKLDVIPGLTGNQIQSDQTLCLGTVASILTGSLLSGGTGNYTYQWQSSAQSSVWANLSGETQAVYNPGSLSATTYFRRLVQSGICSFTTNTILIEITPGITNNVILASQSVCSGQAPILTGTLPSGGIGIYSYQWESSLDGSSWSVILGGNQRDYTAPGMTQAVYFRRRVTGTPCAPIYSNMSQILILPLIGNNTTGNAQTICQGSSPSAFTGSVPSGGTGTYQYQWESALSSSGPWTGITNATLPAFVPPVLTQSTWYRRTVTSFACVNSSVPFEIAVNSFITQNTIDGHQTICQGSTPTLLTGSMPSGGNGIYVYQWQSSANTSAWSTVSGANQSDYQPPVLHAGTYYRRVVTSSPCLPSTSSWIWIRVDSVIGNNQIQASQTICSGQQPQALSGVLPSGGNSQFIYQWESSQNSSTWVTISGATQTGYQPVVLTQNAYFRRLVQAGVCSPSSSAGLVILVLPAIQQDQIGSAQTICSGSAPVALTGTIPIGGNGVFFYQWESSPNQSVWNVISGGSLPDYTPPVLTTSTYFRRGVSSGACTQYNSTVLVWVLPFPSNNLIGSAQTLCPGAIPAQLTGSQPSGSTGAYQYQWESSLTGIGWGSVTSGNQIQYAPPALSQTHYFRRLVSSLPCPTISSDTIRLLVLPLIGNHTIGNAQTICQGTAPQVLTGSLPTGGNGVYSYQWQSATHPTGTWVNMMGGTQAGLISPVLNNSVYYRRMVQSFVCTDASLPVFIEVQAPLTGNSIGSNQTICSGNTPASLTGSLPSGGNGLYQYQWESSLNNSNWTVISGSSLSAFSPPSLGQTTFYRRLVSSPPCAVSTSATLTILVEQPPGNNIISSNQTLCAGQWTSVVTGSIPSGGDGVYAYQWESSLNASTWSNISGSTQSVLLPLTLQQTTYYRRIVQSGICPSSWSNSIEVRIFPGIAQNVIIPAQTICTGTMPLTFSGLSPSGGDGLFTFQWLVSSDQQNWILLVGGTQGNYTSGILNSVQYFRRVVYSSACSDSSNILRVWIELSPGQNAIGNNQTICSGQAFQALTGTQPTGGNSLYAYQWQSSGDNTTWANVPGLVGAGLPGVALTNSIYFRRVVASGVCPSSSSPSVFIRVWPLISNNIIGIDQTICAGTAPQPITGSIPLGGDGLYQFQWLSSRQPFGPWSASGVQSQSISPSVLQDTLYYRRLVSSNSVCTDSGHVVSIFVNPILGGNGIQSAQTICLGSIPATLTGTSPTGGNGQYSYQWESGLLPSAFVTISGGQQAGHSPTALIQTHYYRRIVSAGVCPSHTSFSLEIKVDSFIGNNQIGNAQTICSGQSPTAFTGSLPTGGNGSHGYQWELSGDGLNWSNVSGGNQSGLQEGVLTAHQYYRRRVDAGVCPAHSSDSIFIQVDPPIIGNQIQSGQTICLGDSSQILTGVLPSGGDGLYTYSWESSPDGVNWLAISGETHVDLGQQLPQDTVYYRRRVNSRNCQHISNTATLITNLLIGANQIQSHQTLCSGQVPALYSGTIPSGGNGVYQFTWQSTLDQTAWVSIPGSNQMNWQEGLLSDSVWYRRMVQAGPCPTDTSGVLEVIVYPPIAGSGIFPNQTICSGSAFLTLSGTAPSGGSGNYGFQWLSSTTGASGPWFGITGGTGNLLPGFGLTSTTWMRRVVISGAVCVDSGNVVRILVNEVIGQNNLLSHQTICLGSLPQLLTGSMPTGGNGIYGFTWQSSTDSVFWQSIPMQNNRDLPPIFLSQSHYFRRLVSSPPCPVSTSGSILVTVDMPIGNNAVAGDQTICTGSVPALISGSSPSGGNSFYQYQWESSPLSSNWQAYIPGQTNVDLQPPVATETFLVRRLVQAGVCRPDTSTFSRIEVEQPIGNNIVLASQTVCQGVFPQLLSGTMPSGGNGQYTYAWQSTGIPFNWVSIAGETDTDYQPPFPVTASYYRRIVQSGFCPPETSVPVDLDFIPEIGNNLIFADQTICYAQQPGLLTGSFPSGGSGLFGYEWQMSIDNLNWATWGGGTQQNLNTGPMVFPLFFRRIAGSGSCIPSTSNTVYVHVFGPLGNNIIGPAQTLCSGGIPDPLTGTLPTGGTNSYTYQWQSSSNGISGWVSIPGQTLSTYISGVMTQTAYFRRQIISGLCQGLGNGNAVRIVVLSVQSIGNNFITPAQSLCLNDVAVPLSGTIPTGGTGIYDYEWISSNDLNLWQGNIAASRDFVPPIITASVYYRRVVRTGTCRPDTTTTLPIIVYPRIAQNNLNGNQTLCAGSVPALLTGNQPSGGTGSYGYMWEVSLDSIVWQPANGGSNQNYQTGVLLNVQYYRRIVWSGPCLDTSNALTLVPVPPIQNNTILPNQTLCNGLVPFLLTGATPSGGNGLYQYQWQSGADGMTWFDLSGGTQNDCNPGVLFANTYFRRIVISLPCSDTSQATWVTVYPMLGNNQIFSNQTLCSGQTPSLISGSIPSGGNGSFQYEWHESVNHLNWQVIPGGSGQNLQYPVLSNTQYLRRIISSAGCPSDTTQTLTIEVYPTLYSNIISASQTVCQGNTFMSLNGSIPSGGNQMYGFQWLSSPSSFGPWSPISGETMQAYSPGALNFTSFVRRFVNSGGVCSDSSNLVELRIIPLTSGNTIGPAQTICSGSSFLMLSGPQPSGGSGGWNYIWQYSHDALFWTDVYGQYSPSLPGFSLSTPMYFRRIAASWPCAPDTSSWVRIEVDLPVTGNFIQSDQTICRGQTPVAFFGSSPQQGNGQFNYQWEGSVGNGIWNALSGATASSYSSGPLLNTSWFRRRVISGVCNQSLSDSIRVFVLPSITGNIIQSDQTICLGQMTAQISGTQASGGNQTYQIQWYQQPLAQSVWTPLSGQQWNDLPALVFAESVRLRRVITSAQCVDSGNVVTVIMNPGIGDHLISSNQTLCQGTLPEVLTGTTPSGGNGLFNWQWETSLDGLNWQLLNGLNQATIQPGIPSALTYYRRLSISPPCSAVYSNVVQLNPLPVIGNNFLQGNQTICSGNAPALITGSIPSGGNSIYIYLWQSSSDNLSWLDLPGNSSRDYQAGILSQSVYYRRIVESQPCQDTSASVFIQVNPTPQILISDTLLCLGDSVFLQASAVPGGGIFTWNVPPYNAPGLWVKPIQSTTYSVDYGLNGCFATEDVSVTVLSLPTARIDYSGNLKICSGDSLRLNYNGTHFYQWEQNGNVLATNTAISIYNNGVYYLSVTDGNGCIAEDSVVVQEGSPLVLQLSSIDPSCAGGMDGAASVSVSGGFPPYQYLWSNGQQTPSATGLGWGTFQVLVEDSEGCLSNQQVVLFSPTALIIQDIQSIPINCFSGASGSAIVNVTGGTPPYQYFWNTVPPQNSASASGLKAGTYQVRIVDAQGCQTQGFAVITQPASAVSANITGPEPRCPGDSGVIRIIAFGGTAPYHYEWSPDQGLEYTTEMVTRVYFQQPITYSVKITDASGCVLNQNYTLPVLPVPQARFSVLYETPDSILRNQSPVQIRNFSTPSSLRYWWDFGDSTGIDSVFEPLYNYFVTDTYKITLMVENTYGCRDTAYQWVDYRNIPFIHFPNAFSPNGDGINDYFSIPSLNLIGFNIKIFDRWGNMVYISDDPAFRWDGALAGKGLPEGAYTFYFIGSGINEERIEGSGVVTLIR